MTSNNNTTNTQVTKKRSTEKVKKYDDFSPAFPHEFRPFEGPDVQNPKENHKGQLEVSIDNENGHNNYKALWTIFFVMCLGFASELYAQNNAQSVGTASSWGNNNSGNFIASNPNLSGTARYGSVMRRDSVAWATNTQQPNIQQQAPVQHTQNIQSSQNTQQSHNKVHTQQRQATQTGQDIPNMGESLESAIEHAVTVSRQLQSKEYETYAATKKTDAARGLAMPKVSNATSAVTMSEQYMFQSNVDLKALGVPIQIPFETPLANKDFVTSVTSVVMPIYQGGRVRAMIESSTAMVQALESGKKVTELDLKYQVVENYFLVLRMEKLLQVAQEAEATANAHVQDAQRLFKNGLVTRNVVLAAQVAQSEARQTVVKTNNASRLSQAAYNRLLWRPLTTPVYLQEREVPPLSGDLESLTATALGQRPELSALNSKARAIAAQGKVHRANLRPQISAMGAHLYTENDSVSPNSNYTAAVGMVWMPFDGGTSRAEQDSASFEAMSVNKQQEDARTAIELQVYQCWLDEQETRERLNVAQTAKEQATENYRVVNRSFQEGLVNHTEVLDAQTLKTSAGVNLTNAQYDAISATWRLNRAMGNL